MCNSLRSYKSTFSSHIYKMSNRFLWFSSHVSNRPQWKRSTKNYVVKVTSAFIPLLLLFYYNNQIDKCYMKMCTITGSKDARWLRRIRRQLPEKLHFYFGLLLIIYRLSSNTFLIFFNESKSTFVILQMLN